MTLSLASLRANDHRIMGGLAAIAGAAYAVAAYIAPTGAVHGYALQVAAGAVALVGLISEITGDPVPAVPTPPAS